MILTPSYKSIRYSFTKFPDPPSGISQSARLCKRHVGLLKPTTCTPKPNIGKLKIRSPEDFLKTYPETPKPLN